jgi:hypothetical protein
MAKGWFYGRTSRFGDMHAMKGPYSTAATKAPQSRHLAATDGGNIRMISEGCSNAGSILDHFVLFHPDIELLDFGDPKIFQMCRRLFESRFCSLFPRIRAAADQTDDSIQTHLIVSFCWFSSRRTSTSRFTLRGE